MFFLVVDVPEVSLQVWWYWERSLTELAGVGLFTSVGSDVSGEVGWARELFTTKLALILLTGRRWRELRCGTDLLQLRWLERCCLVTIVLESSEPVSWDRRHGTRSGDWQQWSWGHETGEWGQVRIERRQGRQRRSWQQRWQRCLKDSNTSVSYNHYCSVAYRAYAFKDNFLLLTRKCLLTNWSHLYAWEVEKLIVRWTQNLQFETLLPDDTEDAGWGEMVERSSLLGPEDGEMEVVMVTACLRWGRMVSCSWLCWSVSTMLSGEWWSETVTSDQVIILSNIFIMSHHLIVTTLSSPRTLLSTSSNINAQT